MLIGFNNDVQYRGKTFHVQTEDRGLQACQIETQIFHAGAIFDTRIVSYTELAGEADVDARNARIRKLMQTTHRELYRNLLEGKYDAMAGLEPRDGDASEAVIAPEEFTPSQERVPDSARQLEEGHAMEIEEAPSGVSHVDLNTLRAKLAKLDITAPSPEADEEEEAPTQVTSLDAIPDLLQSDRVKKVEAPASPSPRATLPPLQVPRRAATAELSYPLGTGVSAWDGCTPGGQDLSLISLIEAHLAST